MQQFSRVDLTKYRTDRALNKMETICNFDEKFNGWLFKR